MSDFSVTQTFLDQDENRYQFWAEAPAPANDFYRNRLTPDLKKKGYDWVWLITPAKEFRLAIASSKHSDLHYLHPEVFRTLSGSKVF